MISSKNIGTLLSLFNKPESQYILSDRYQILKSNYPISFFHTSISYLILERRLSFHNTYRKISNALMEMHNFSTAISFDVRAGHYCLTIDHDDVSAGHYISSAVPFGISSSVHFGVSVGHNDSSSIRHFLSVISKTQT